MSKKILKRQKIVNYILILFSVFSIIAGTVTFIEFSSTNNILGIIFVSMFAYLFGIYGLINCFRFKIIIADNYIEKNDIIKKRIYFESVDFFSYDNGIVIVKSGKKEVKIPKDINCDHKLLIDIENKIKNNPNIRIVGDFSLV